MRDHHTVPPSVALFKPYLEQVRRELLRLLPRQDWPELANNVEAAFADGLGPLALLPLASAGAAGADPALAVGVGAAWMALQLGVSVLDNLADRDRPGLWQSIGPGRAATHALGLAAMCVDWVARLDIPAPRSVRLTRELASAALVVASGQDRDLAGIPMSLEETWETTVRKNGHLFSLGCVCGAAAVTDDQPVIDALRDFGVHLGVALQCFDDLEGTWYQTPSDLAAGKGNLALAYGLEAPHPDRDELVAIVRQERLADEETTVKQILDDVGARRFLLAAALEERDRALTSLAPCPGREGVALLTDYVDSLFTRAAELLSPEDAEALGGNGAGSEPQ